MKKLMIVDDSAIMRKAIERYLKELDVEIVAVAGNGKEAVKLFESLKPDIVTLDITMPELDGLAALELMMKSRPDATVIIVSALSSKAIALQALKGGAKAFILKPFEPDELVQTIKAAMGN